MNRQRQKTDKGKARKRGRRDGDTQREREWEILRWERQRETHRDNEVNRQTIKRQRT